MEESTFHQLLTYVNFATDIILTSIVLYVVIRIRRLLDGETEGEKNGKKERRKETS